MDEKTLAIPIAFILLAAVLCWQLIGAKGRWWAKLITILVVPGFGLAVWASITSYKGWPTQDETPEKAIMLAGAVHEPNPKTRDPGAIFLWLVPLKNTQGINPLDYVSSGGEPRAYQLPYSRQAHNEVEGAKARMRAGQPVMFERGKKGAKGNRGRRGRPGDGVEQPGGPGSQGNPNGAPGLPGYGTGDDQGGFSLHQFPTPTSPPKEPEQ